MERVFFDRAQAGLYLTEYLRGESLDLVLGLPRGGVVVAYEVAKGLKLPLGVIVVRKLGVPDSPEVAFGAVAPGVRVIEHEMVRRLNIPESDIKSVLKKEELELKKRTALLGPTPDLRSKRVVIVDDGVATGSTARAAIYYAKKFNPQRITLAVPVCAPDIAGKLKNEVALICLQSPSDFLAVGQFYYNFEQVTDEEVLALAKKARS
jgi:putative phosphoribosyl transferase